MKTTIPIWLRTKDHLERVKNGKRSFGKMCHKIARTNYSIALGSSKQIINAVKKGKDVFDIAVTYNVPVSTILKIKQENNC